MIDVCRRSCSADCRPESPDFRVHPADLVATFFFNPRPRWQCSTYRGERMQNRFVTTAGLAVLVGGIAGCSSSTPAAPARPPGAPPVGTAQVTVDAADAATIGSVNCTQAESLVTITAGDNASGMTAVVDLASKPTVKSVSINNLGGFTGSYWQDLGPAAQVRTGTKTYQITGTADGFHVDTPSFRKTETFAIKVAC